jgi:putative DNA methylase
MKVIETDEFPFEFLSRVAERESWRKELHRPIYHVHKWWANRLGSVFRGILLGCALPKTSDLEREFYCSHAFFNQTVLDPFMGSGTTVGEAHKLGFTAFGRDINPVAVEAVRTALGPMDRGKLLAAFDTLESEISRPIRGLYQSKDAQGRQCEVLYNFWVMQAGCQECHALVDLFRTYVIGRHAFPNRRPDVQLLCPACRNIFPGRRGETPVVCPSCRERFDPTCGPAQGKIAICGNCQKAFSILDSISSTAMRPTFRLYGKLVLTVDGHKEYLPTSKEDIASFELASRKLQAEISDGTIMLPNLALEKGYNTRQAMGYGFRSWRDFFNDRQLLALCWLKRAIERIEDDASRIALRTLFSGVLEFNNLFASYKGEGTGAVRHMFSHHILKPERTPIEANLWGTPKSSGSFSGLFRLRLLRALDYRESPTELMGRRGSPRVCSPPFSGRLEPKWPTTTNPTTADNVRRGIYISCGDSSFTGLADRSIDLVVTDPPFFDNVHYSELADFFHAWQHDNVRSNGPEITTTRSSAEVQDTDAGRFATKLQGVFKECARVLKDEGLLAFAYHHSRSDGWRSLAEAILRAGFRVVNSQPVKGEMSVAAPKSLAKEPIQFDIILICRKHLVPAVEKRWPVDSALESARIKIRRLMRRGFRLSKNDRRIVIFGQLLTTLNSADEIDQFVERVDKELESPVPDELHYENEPTQKLLF